MVTKTLKIGLFVMAVASFSFVGAQEKLTQNKVDSQKMFTHIDTDANGSISLEEFKANRMKDPSKKVQVEKRFSQIDTDANGSIDKKEFQTFMEQPRMKNQKNKQKNKEKNKVEKG